MNNLEKFITHNSKKPSFDKFLNERKTHNENGALFINLDKNTDNDTFKYAYD